MFNPFFWAQSLKKMVGPSYTLTIRRKRIMSYTLHYADTVFARNKVWDLRYRIYIGPFSEWGWLSSLPWHLQQVYLPRNPLATRIKQRQALSVRLKSWHTYEWSFLARSWSVVDPVALNGIRHSSTYTMPEDTKICSDSRWPHKAKSSSEESWY